MQNYRDVLFLWETKMHNSLHGRHNECDGVSNHRRLDCLLGRLFRRRSKRTSKLRVTGLCAANSSVAGEFPAQRASNQVKADPRSTYVRCLRVVRRSRVGVRRASVNLTFWLCCYFLVVSSHRQHCNTSRDWQWVGEIPCQIYIPESRSWSFPFVCKSLEPAEVCPNFQVHSALGAYYRLNEKSPRHEFINDRKVNVCWTNSHK